MRVDVVILGAGAAGLGAGLALDDASTAFRILEGDDAAGGLLRTDVVDGFSFDRTGHVLHFARPHIEAGFRELGVELERIERRAGILLGDTEVPYPFQYNLWALESRSLARAVVDDMRTAPRRNGAGSFADLLRSLWGESALALFFRPYNEKLWGRPLEALPADCAGRYLPEADVELAERGAQREVGAHGYNNTFLYPASGRLGDLMTALAAPIADRVCCGVSVEAVDIVRRELRTEDGGTIAYGRLISTIPLDVLLRMSGLRVDPDLFAATEVVNIRIGLRGSLRTANHWLYVADRELPFHRIGFPQNVNRRTCPDGCTSLSIESTIPASGQRLSTDDIAATALECMSRRGFVDVEEYLFHDEFLISPAYVVQRAPERDAFAEIERTLREHGLFLAGRFGTWDYLSVEEAFESGVRAAGECSRASA